MFPWIMATILAFVVKGLTGFGDGLVFGSCMSFVSGYSNITPVETVLSLPSNGILTWRNRKELNPGMILPVTAVLLAGDLLGILILKNTDTRYLKIGFGLLIAALGVEMLLRERNTEKLRQSNGFLTVIGVISGVLCGIFGIGALLSAYFSRTTTDTGSFKGNICAVFTADNLFRLIMYRATGILTKEILFQALILLPVMILSLGLGMFLSRILREKTVKKIVIVMLIISGIALTLTNLF